ncbi:MAG: hypothetical protein ACQETO_05920 [Pseudomonadota bacterium]
MIVVIQCANKKKPDAGYLQCRDGRKVMLVADPEEAPAESPYAYARPDDASETGTSWRNELLRYNESPDNNPFRLLPAYQLYGNGTYELLAERYGTNRLYILSAGWGLIAADFLTPRYDITFSAQADRYKRRRKKDQYNDFRMLPADTTDPVLFFVSQEYVPLACELTTEIKAPRYLFYNSKTPPDAPDCTLKKFETRTRTNWQYECARAFMDGKVGI